MSDREPFEQAREAGLRARHETREARAIRKQVAEEIALALAAAEVDLLDDYRLGLRVAARIAREIGTKETQP